MWKFIRFELRYWLKTPMVWIFMFIYALFAFFATASENVIIGDNAGNVFKNSPYQIQNYYVTMSVVCLLMTTAFMNAIANRDFQFGMHQFVFSSPIKKRDYFFGKFIGAVMVSVLPMIGLSLGTLLGPPLSALFEMAPPERFGEVYWSAHLQGLLSFGLPNVIISGVLLFSLAIIFRSTIVSFIGSMLILVFYIISGTFTKDIQDEWLANLLDPFGRKPFYIMTKYMTPSEKNFNVVPLADELLVNRLVWVAVALFILVLVYWRFSFNTRREKAKKEKKRSSSPMPLPVSKIFEPTKAGVFSWRSFWKLISFETLSIIKNPTYIIIMVIGLIILIVNLSTLTSLFGTTRYPVTYIVVENIEDAYNLFMYGFITFYTGVLVWKERDAKINEIEDATPVLSGMRIAAKIIAIMIAIGLVLVFSILLGIIAQTLYGYTRYELGLYVKSLLVIRMTKLFFLCILSLLFHYLINNRYIAWFAFVTFVIVNSFLWGLLEINTNMLAYGFLPTITYSDMNGFGPFVAGATWFSVYWALFSLLLALTIALFYTRGKEEQFRYRWFQARHNFIQGKTAILVALIAFAVCGGFVFYNTKILNKYDAPDEGENKQVSYEKKYKKYEHLNQPRYVSIDYRIDIYPEQRNLKTHATAWIKNISDQPITDLHLTMPQSSEDVTINVAGKLQTNDKDLFYRIYKLDQPLLPKDSLALIVQLNKPSKGFENEVSFTQLTHNGTFFNNTDIMPSIGYNKDMEISDKNRRVKLKLPKRERMPALDDNNRMARANTYIGSDADWVMVNTVISTSADQTAVAPGSLVKSWTKGDRKYFNYKLDQKALNFYSFISGRYQIARQKWSGIDLEVYYDQQHAYNVPNMMASMQKSLDYYTRNFGPYFHKQCRIIEFPRYASFAQAFPGTMPYSEAIGFITDLRDVKQKDIDMVFYVVAHEMAHQYWAHQICGANMQGSEMMSEGFAQYSALMVMEKQYGKDKMKKFLQYEMDDYLNGRSGELEGENPLVKTSNQQYIHYNKASVVMYYLKEMVGEHKINSALQNLIATYSYKQPPYPTANAALREFRKVTPDSLQYLVTDLFEKITLFNNRVTKATVRKVPDGYRITVNTLSEKFNADSMGAQTEVPLSDYIDIAVFAEPRSDEVIGKPLGRKRVKINRKENVYTFLTKEEPYQAGIDPYNYLIDRVPEDNLRKIE